MRDVSNDLILDGVIMAGGKMEKSLKPYSDAGSKAFIKIGGRCMVEYIIDTLRRVKRVRRIILAANPEDIPDEVLKMVDKTAPGGEKIMDTLRNAVDSLEDKPHRLLVMPADMPLVSVEAVDDFLDQSLEPPASDLAYAYLSREDSEAVFPDVNHTYVKTRSGMVCGTGFVLMNPALIDDFEALFRKIAKNRKNPIAMACILGLGITLKFLFGATRIQDLEARIKHLLGIEHGRAVQTHFADAGFNIDAPNELVIAKKIIEKNES